MYRFKISFFLEKPTRVIEELSSDEDSCDDVPYESDSSDESTAPAAELEGPADVVEFCLRLSGTQFNTLADFLHEAEQHELLKYEYAKIPQRVQPDERGKLLEYFCKYLLNFAL